MNGEWFMCGRDSKGSGVGILIDWELVGGISAKGIFY